MVRAAASAHPQWVFALADALCMYDVKGSQSFGLYAGETLTIMSRNAGKSRDSAYLRRVTWDDSTAVFMAGGARVTSPHKTMFDCALAFDFRDALGIFDMFAAQGIDMCGVRALCALAKCDTGNVQRLLDHYDPLSANGGEAHARGVMLDGGFVPPQLQHRFDNPNHDDWPYMTDFLWYGANGRVIVAEFDGMEKYGTDSLRIKQKVAQQTARDEVLRSHGVTHIVHFTWEDVCNPRRLWKMLADAGVPYLDSRRNPPN